MIEQLQSFLDCQRMRLQQLSHATHHDRAANLFAMQVQEICDGLELAISAAESLEKNKELEAALHEQVLRTKPELYQIESKQNPLGFELTQSPRPEEQGTLHLEPSRPIPPAPQYQGSMRDRYEIYVTNATSLGWQVKTFDEWMNS